MRNDTRQNATTTTPRSLWITAAAMVSGTSIAAQVSGVSGGVRESTGHPLTCENTRCPECPGGFGVRGTSSDPVDNSFPQVRAGEASLRYSRVAKCPEIVRTPSDLHKHTTARGVREAKERQFRCDTGCPVLSPLQGRRVLRTPRPRHPTCKTTAAPDTTQQHPSTGTKKGPTQ